MKTRIVSRLAQGIRSRTRLIAGFADAFFPDHCSICDREIRTPSDVKPRRPFCRACEAGLPWWRAIDGCPRCGGLAGASMSGCPDCLAEGSPLHACRALLRYEAEMRRFVPAFKQPQDALGPVPAVARTIDHLASRFANRLARDASLAGSGGLAAIDLVTSLPLHPRRYAERSFNHADVLARPIARAFGVPFDPTLLRRTRNTTPQASLTGAARRANVRGAFAASGPGLEARRIGLVDDVLTTGSTLSAAADALLDAGALEVYGLTLVATLPPRARRPRVAARPPDAAYPRAAKPSAE